MPHVPASGVDQDAGDAVGLGPRGGGGSLLGSKRGHSGLDASGRPSKGRRVGVGYDSGDGTDAGAGFVDASGALALAQIASHGGSY